MVKIRLVACLLWRDGSIIQSVTFNHTNAVGNATTAVDFFNVWAIDEIVLLNVSRDQEMRSQFLETVKRLSKRCFVPLTIGGWVTSVQDMRELLNSGADKIAVNTQAFRDHDLIREGSRKFGSQCIVVSIDAKMDEDGYEVVIDRGSESTGVSPEAWAKKAEELGAGEVFLTSIDKDGSKEGYDTDLIKQVSESVTIPIVASGGVGEWEHLIDGVKKGNADAVSVANKFHHTQHSTKEAKEKMIEAGLDVRKPVFYKVKTTRVPKYQVTGGGPTVAD